MQLLSMIANQLMYKVPVPGIDYSNADIAQFFSMRWTLAVIRGIIKQCRITKQPIRHWAFINV